MGARARWPFVLGLSPTRAMEAADPGVGVVDAQALVPYACLRQGRWGIRGAAVKAAGQHAAHDADAEWKEAPLTAGRGCEKRNNMMRCSPTPQMAEIARHLAELVRIVRKQS